MSPKRVRTRVTAEAELQEGIAYYVSERALDAALGLVDEFEWALGVIADHPAIGSARLEAELGIPDLRTFALRKFPYVVVYFDTVEFVDVRHFLHTSRDLPRRLAE